MKKYLFLENKTEKEVPLFECSNNFLEEIYDFRWNVFHKHIKKTDAGYVITEFLPDVWWSGIYNTINCATGHHIYEGRWLHNREIIDEYENFWFTKDAEPRKYSTWLADAIYKRDCVLGDFEQSKKLYQNLSDNLEKWKSEKLDKSGLFYQIDDRDGMEFSIGGSGLRPTINSYMYAEMEALEKISLLLEKNEDAKKYYEQKEKLYNLINKELWNKDAEFFETLNEQTMEFVNVREQVGYIPWYFGIPDEEKSLAWKYLNSKEHFYGEYGPTTAERNHKDFMKEHDHECLWNGPSWPYATTQTLLAMANLLNDYTQDVVTVKDYVDLLTRYAKSQYITENEVTKPHIDEDLHPDTGEWISRNILFEMYEKEDNPALGGPTRGTDYNHSGFCDLVITGLAGIRPSSEKVLKINPLAEGIEYFCLDGVKYHGKYITIVWDKNGDKYEKGLAVYVNGEKKAQADNLTLLEVEI